MTFDEFVNVVDAKARESMTSSPGFDYGDTIVAMGLRAKLATWTLNGASVKFLAMSSSGIVASVEAPASVRFRSAQPAKIVTIREESIDQGVAWVLMLTQTGA